MMRNLCAPAAFLLFFVFLGGQALASPLTFTAQAAATEESQKFASGQLTAPGQPAEPGLTEGQRTISAQQAVTMLSKAAEGGDAEAMMGLASFYEQGLGVPRDMTKALSWYEKAAGQNFPNAFYQLGLAYEAGKGVKADREQALKNFQKAAELKVAEAPYKLASLAMTSTPAKPDEKKALEYLKAGGITGAQAMETIGTFYENGVGVAPNYSTAFNWYKKAAEAGRAEALFRLGICYETGFGAAVDPQAALAAFQKASDLKMGAASYKLAAIYLGGVLIPPDSKKAVAYLQTALANGHAVAANELGVIYLQGRLDQPLDTDKALEMFLKSAELGNAEAMKNIAVMYKNGLGRKQDPAQALRWYLIAAKAGYKAEGLEGLIGEMKTALTPEQVKAQEEAADKWLAAAAAKRNQAAK